MTELSSLITKFRQKNIRALTRLISMAEDSDESVLTALADLFKEARDIPVVGITGPPGAGKSTLSGEMIRFFRAQNKRVAVIAVDPMSPLTGGSLLGDRIRLTDHFNDPDVFIRSLSTRGTLGGVSVATRQILHLLSAFGFDAVIIETVGVGQSEVEIRKLAHVTVVVLTPESGDSIQVLKAGLLEIGDIYVVNKADREGAETLASELRWMLQSSHREKCPVLLTQQKVPESAVQFGKVVTQSLEAVARVRAQKWKQSLLESFQESVRLFLERESEAWLRQRIGSSELTNPYQWILEFRKKYPSGFITHG